MEKLLLIVPAYNEEACILETIKMLRTQPYDFIVVSDGSTDKTSKIVKDMGEKLIDLPFNQGLPGAFSAGMEFAEQNGYTYVLQFDADGQHLPEYVTPMLSRMIEGDYDILIGSRYIDSPMPKSMRSFGSKLIRTMLLLTTKKKICDPTSGMRMYGKRMISLYSKRPDLAPEPDTLAYLIRNGAKVSEFPVTMHERTAGTSYLGSWSATKYMIRMAFSILIIQFARTKINRM